MKTLHRWMFLGCVFLLLVSMVWSGSVWASPALIDPRINRLESQVRSLQSQVTRLQGQIPRGSNDRSPRTIPEEPSSDQQFDTLAILIIELQERVSVLEARLDAAEESFE